MYVRAGLFAGVLMSGLFMPLWFFVGVVAVYTLWFGTYELVVVGLLIDGYFGEPGHLFSATYTGITLVSAIVLRYIKPYLRFFAED